MPYGMVGRLGSRATAGRDGPGLQGSCACRPLHRSSEQVGRAQGQPSWGSGCLSVPALPHRGLLPDHCHTPWQCPSESGLTFQKLQGGQTKQAPGAVPLTGHLRMQPGLGLSKWSSRHGPVGGGGHQRSGLSARPAGAIKLPPEVKDGSPCHWDAESRGDVVTGLI